MHNTTGIVVIRWLAALVASVLTGVWGTPTALAQPEDVERVRVSVVANTTAVEAGKPFVLAVTLDHDEGWHTHTNTPEIPASWGDFPATPTSVTLTRGVGSGGTGSGGGGIVTGPVQWPKAKQIKVDFLGTGVPDPYLVFEGRATIFVPVVLAQVDASGVTLDVVVGFQACDDTICQMPMTKRMSLVLPAASSSVLASGANEAAFAGFDAAVLAQSASWAGTDSGVRAGASGDGGGPASGTSAAAPTSKFLGLIPVPEGGGVVSAVVVFLLAVLGGFVLNLTPCVLPVLPLKVMAIVQHAGSAGRAMYLGLWMAAGVTAFWALLGLPVVLLSTFSDPSRVFGIWWVTLGLGLIICVLSVGLMGLFNITLPQAVYSVNPKADSAGGSFVFGIMTAVLGLPCFGFVAGSLLGAAATLPKVFTLLIFLGLGVGMALPYLILAAKPEWLKRVPRSGPAGDLVKQVMGLLLLAAGVYFVGAGLIALVASKPWYAKQLHVWGAAVLGIIAGVWLLYRMVSITKSGVARSALGLVALLLASGGTWYAMDSTQRARVTHLERQAALEASGEGVLLTGTWIDYSPVLFERARNERRVVLLDFTAEWCINCKALKAAVLDRPDMKSHFKEQEVVLMTVDLTATDAPGWAKLKALGRQGIPTLAIYTPGQETPWVANTYTRETVLAEVTRAAQARTGVVEGVTMRPGGV